MTDLPVQTELLSVPDVSATRRDHHSHLFVAPLPPRLLDAPFLWQPGIGHRKLQNCTKKEFKIPIKKIFFKVNKFPCLIMQPTPNA